MSGGGLDMVVALGALCAVILLTGLLGKRAISVFEWLAGCLGALAFVVLS